MDTSPTFKRKIERLNYLELQKLLHNTVIKQERRRVRFSKSRSSRDGNLYLQCGWEIAEIKQAMLRHV